MSFLRANIDRAIVMTQYDLRGFAHPFGHRVAKGASAKSLAATTCNFMNFANGAEHGAATDEAYADAHESSFDAYFAMCKRMAKVCDLSEKEAIQLIVLEIIKQSEEMKAEVVAGKREPSGYLKPLEKDNYWGKVVLALVEAFEVKLEQTTPTAA
jgi:hypothetical protein